MGTRTLKSMTGMLTLNNKAFKKGLGNSRKELNKFSSSVKGLSSILVGAFSARSIINFTVESAKLAAQMEGVSQAFERIKPNIGFLNDLKRATAGTVAEIDLMKRAVMASNFKIPLTELASLMQFATKRAQETGESVDYLVNSIVIGIGRKSPLILDNLGISAVELRKKLEGVGHSGATVVQVAKAIGEIATESMKDMGDITETSAIRYARLAAEVRNMKTDLGDMANEILVVALPALEKFLGGIEVIIDDWNSFGTHRRKLMAQDFIDTWDTDLDNVKSTLSAIERIDPFGNLSEQELLIKAINEEIKKQQEAMMVPGGLYGDYHKYMIKGLQDYIEEIKKFGVEGETGAETIANLKAEMAELVKIQESLPRGHQDLSKIAARIKEIKEIIAEMRGEEGKAAKETREFLPLLDQLIAKADKGYSGVANYFNKLAEEGKKLREELMDSMGVVDVEEWLGGKEEWEDYADQMKKATEMVELMRMSFSQLFDLWQGEEDPLKKAELAGIATKKVLADLNESIKKELLTSLPQVGEELGRLFAGLEADFNRLGSAILENLGYLMIVAGFKLLELNPAVAAGLIAGGAIIQFGSGLWRGASAGVPGGAGSSRGRQDVTFRIQGKDLVGTLERYNISNSHNT